MSISSHRWGRAWRTSFAVVAAGALALLSVPAFASSVDTTSVVDATAPTGTVTLAPGGSGSIKINLSVTGRQDNAASFKVYRDWTLAGGAFTGSNPQTFNVAPRAASDPATTFSADGTVTVDAGQSDGTFTVTVSPFGVVTSAPAALGAGSGSTYQVKVETPTPGDTTAPVLDLPTTVTAEATSASGATVTYTASATDAVDGPVAVNCAPASGDTFPLGTTGVSCSATDSHNNTATGTFDVTVEDTTAPDVTVPSDVTAEATGPSGAVVTYSASATDAVDGSPAVTCDPASGSTFAITETTVTCESTDTAGNKGTNTFKVTVEDTTAPDVTVPSDVTAEATGPSGAVVTYSASATDAVDGSPAVTCDPASGSTFAITETTVTCESTDTAGNKGTNTFKVTVEDTTAPDVTVPSDVTAEATGPSGAVVTYSASATDAVDGSPAVTCDPASGSTFAITETTVTCESTDTAGNKGTNTFKVTVQDTIAPNVSLVGGPADGGVYYFGNVPAAPTCTASDSGSGLAGPCSVSGYSAAIGTHTVTASASDVAGNEGTASASYEVKSWTTGGFYAPVDMNNVYNTVKGGSTVPLKFELFAGSEISDTSAIKSFTYNKVNCTSGVEDAVETLATTGGTSLRYDTTAGQFIQNWKTPTGAGTCYRATVTAQDGTAITALFKIK